MLNVVWDGQGGVEINGIVALDQGELDQLFEIVKDGTCPLCSCDISANDLVCCSCLQRILFVHGGNCNCTYGKE